jgi:hypothetical protein
MGIGDDDARNGTAAFLVGLPRRLKPLKSGEILNRGAESAAPTKSQLGRGA